MADTSKTQEDNQHDLYPLYMLLTMGGVGILLGLTPLLMTISNRRASGVLRGRFLSSAVCARFPAIRDCLQNCGTMCRIKWLSLGARDSLESVGSYDEGLDEDLVRYDKLRHWRRQNPTIIGVRPSMVIHQSAPSGFKWKKKWRDRRKRNKLKRQLKNQTRKAKLRESLDRKKGGASPNLSITKSTDSARSGNSLSRSPQSSPPATGTVPRADSGKKMSFLSPHGRGGGLAGFLRRLSGNAVTPASLPDSVPKT